MERLERSEVAHAIDRNWKVGKDWAEDYQSAQTFVQPQGTLPGLLISKKKTHAAEGTSSQKPL
jgi:hypothetical protein